MSLHIAIIEDEPAAARNLQFMLQEADAGLKVLGVLTGVADAVSWLQQNKHQCDLIFMDIRLSDGLSFEIFDKVKIEVPVIFVTAYNDYALQAFKANCIHYILKPFDEAELVGALEKFKMLRGSAAGVGNYTQLQQIAEKLKDYTGNYKQSFLVHVRDKLVPLSVQDIAWFYTRNEVVYAQSLDNKQFIIEFTMEQLQQQLNPQHFFRSNRQFIVHRKAILEIDFYFNGRLLVKVKPEPEEKMLISKARVPEFKAWMNA